MGHRCLLVYFSESVAIYLLIILFCFFEWQLCKHAIQWMRYTFEWFVIDSNKFILENYSRILMKTDSNIFLMLFCFFFAFASDMALNALSHTIVHEYSWFGHSQTWNSQSIDIVDDNTRIPFLLSIGTSRSFDHSKHLLFDDRTCVRLKSSVLWRNTWNVNQPIKWWRMINVRIKDLQRNILLFY